MLIELFRDGLSPISKAKIPPDMIRTLYNSIVVGHTYGLSPTESFDGIDEQFVVLSKEIDNVSVKLHVQYNSVLGLLSNTNNKGIFVYKTKIVPPGNYIIIDNIYFLYQSE